MQIPTLETSIVYHVGTMESSDKGVHFKHSLEGHCLSVSHHPDAWVKIAKLGGLPYWSLHKLDGSPARFVDAHSLTESPEVMDQIKAWGLSMGLIQERTLYRAWSTDEDDRWRYSLHGSELEASQEVDEDSEGPDGGPAIEPSLTMTGTDALGGIVGRSLHANDDATDMLLLAWAQIQTDLDGVWWSDELDVHALSAPRGGILPCRLQNWTHKPYVRSKPTMRKSTAHINQALSAQNSPEQLAHQLQRIACGDTYDQAALKAAHEIEHLSAHDKEVLQRWINGSNQGGPDTWALQQIAINIESTPAHEGARPRQR